MTGAAEPTQQPQTEAGRELTDVDTIYVLMERVRKAVLRIEAEARQQGAQEALQLIREGRFRDAERLAEPRP